MNRCHESTMQPNLETRQAASPQQHCFTVHQLHKSRRSTAVTSVDALRLQHHLSKNSRVHWSGQQLFIDWLAVVRLVHGVSDHA